MMISFTEAFEQVMAIQKHTGSEQTTLAEATGRILAKDIHADRDLPPFNRSAMDGFACRREDLATKLQVTAAVAAGEIPTHTVVAGECTRIMTGAPVPAGADVVVPFENTEEVATNVIQCCELPARSNIAVVGEDLHRGDVLLRSGTRLNSRHIGTLAACGQVNITVARRPVAGIIATGSELVEPGEQPDPAQIRNSNSSQLTALLEAMGVLYHSYGIVQDTKEAITNVLQQARQECDLLLFSGGVSMGDFDHVPEVFRDCGLKVLFEQVRIKPGKPTTVAVADDVVCFGLPGNPVTVFMVFERLVKPFLFRMMKHNYRERIFRLLLTAEFKRRSARREAWIPICITPSGAAEISSYHGSGHFHALTQADGYIVIPAGVAAISEGESIDVRLF